MEYLVSATCSVLRRSDIVCQYSDTQCLCLLHQIDMDVVPTAVRRIMTEFLHRCPQFEGGIHFEYSKIEMTK